MVVIVNVVKKEIKKVNVICVRENSIDVLEQRILARKMVDIAIILIIVKLEIIVDY